MRGRIMIPVLLGLSLVALPALADRFHRDHQARDHGGRPDPPGHAIERSRPGEDGAQVAARREAPVTRSQERSIGRQSTGKMPAISGRIGLFVNGSSRKACNEADECSMSNGGVKAAVNRAASSTPTGVPGAVKVNNAKGKSLLGPANQAARTAFNEAGEANGMSKFAAQAAVFKAAHSRAFGNGSMAKINNAKGKSMLGRAAPSERMACNEAEECSMNASGAKAEWQKAEAKRRHP